VPLPSIIRHTFAIAHPHPGIPREILSGETKSIWGPYDLQNYLEINKN